MDWTGDRFAPAPLAEATPDSRNGEGASSRILSPASEIQVANGGRLGVSVEALPQRLSPDGYPLLLITFTNTLADVAGLWRASLYAEVGIDPKAEWSLARRRAARSLIAFGLKTADTVAGGDLRPSITPSPAPSSGCAMEYFNRVVTGGMSRGARIDRHVEDGGRHPARLDPDLPREAGAALRRLARELHGAIDLRENRSLFGDA